MKILNIYVILLKRPDLGFLEIIRHFPLVYWTKGSIDW